MLDLEGRVSNWNAGAQRAKGYTADEIVGKDLACSTPKKSASRPAQRALETARREGKFEAQGWRYRKDGSSFWAYVIIDPIYDETGELIGSAKITKDNTKQKADADRIAEITNNLDIALENMSPGHLHVRQRRASRPLQQALSRYLQISQRPRASRHVLSRHRGNWIFSQLSR